MIDVLKKVFGTKQDRDMKNLRPLLKQINNLEADMVKLSDEPQLQPSQYSIPIGAITPNQSFSLSMSEALDFAA